MGEAKKRKVHTAEFKAKVGLEAVRGVKTITEIAQTNGVHPQLVGQRKKEILESVGVLFQTKRGPKPAEDESGERRQGYPVRQMGYWVRRPGKPATAALPVNGAPPHWLAVMGDVVSSMTTAWDQNAKQLQPSAPQKPE